MLYYAYAYFIAHMRTFLSLMDVARPYASVTPSLHGDVLAVFARTTRPLTGREVARLARRGSEPGVRRVLEQLVRQGLVTREEAGPSLLYRLNREHLAVPAVEALASIREQLIERLRQAIATWTLAPVHASLFGSAARGDGDVDSDIDLFVARPADVDPDNETWRRQLDELAADVRAWTGNRAGVAEVSAQDLARLRRERPAIVDTLGRDAITLAGIDAAALLTENR